MWSFQSYFVSALLFLTRSSLALDLDLQDPESIKDAARAIVDDIVGIYNGNASTDIPGLFPRPYYWYEGGRAFDSLINFWALTEDDTYNNLVSKGLLFQTGPENNYMPLNQTASLGNDDQAWWALAAMTAAENGFSDPPPDSGVKSWLQLAQNVFDTQVARWDTEHCDGGLRWQIVSFNLGYNYKNTNSNGALMNLAARLYHYTKNQTYSDWADKVYEWSRDVGFITHDGAVYDGADIAMQCEDPNKIQWTIDLGMYLNAGVYMYNATGSDQWADEITKLYSHAHEAFRNETSGALQEIACQGLQVCTTDQEGFRATLARALANAEHLAPSLDLTIKGATVTDFIDTSAKAAAAQCSGGKDGTKCGSDWSLDQYDGNTGLGQDVSALEMILATLPPIDVQTQNSSGTSGHSNSSATPSGSSSSTSTNPGSSPSTSTNAGSSPSSSATSDPGTGGAGRFGVSIAPLAAVVFSAMYVNGV